MNQIILVGRLGKDPESKKTASGTEVVTFSLGVDRRGKDGKKEVDWIDCTAWSKTGEVVMDYVHKGDRLGVIGTLQTRTWQTENGENRKVYFVLVDKVEFLSEPKTQAEQAPTKPENEVPFEV